MAEMEETSVLIFLGIVPESTWGKRLEVIELTIRGGGNSTLPEQPVLENIRLSDSWRASLSKSPVTISLIRMDQ